MKLHELVDDFHDELWKENNRTDFYPFSYRYNGEEVILFEDCIVYHDSESDRGWDENTEDYIRTEREQVILELTELRDRINETLRVIGGKK